MPFTPFSGANFYGHLLFGLYDTAVRATVCRGRVLMEHGKILGLDEAAIRAQCVERAQRLWGRIA